MDSSMSGQQTLSDKPVKRLGYYRTKIENELKRTMDFWVKHSHDDVNGGFFTCLGRDGQLYDTDKYGWMMGRQVWMYSKLYNESGEYKREDILNAAKSGGEFLMNHFLRHKDYRCYFQVSADGKPIKIQRKLFTECFYTIAMAELGRATGIDKYKEEAEKMLSKIIYWARVDDSDLDVPKHEGSVCMNSMGVPMMILCVIDEVCGDCSDMRARYTADEDWAVHQILQHMQRNNTVILESVSTDGKELPGFVGRHMNPGHAIEAGWFLLKLAIRRNDEELKQTAIEKFIKGSYDLGWDSEHGGIFYFLDADGLSPVPLEWDMKLLWVHNESLIALIMAYEQTKDPTVLKRFDQCFEYSFSKFSDPVHGEWFGYLNRRGEVTHLFKGGPYKGCFHVLRCLHTCLGILKKLEIETAQSRNAAVSPEVSA